MVRKIETWANGCQGMVILSGYTTPLYEDLYQGWTRVCRAAQARSKEMRTECLWIKPVKDAPTIVSVPSKAKRRTVSEIAKSRVKAAAKHPDNGKGLPQGRPKKSAPGALFSKASLQRQRAFENGISYASQRRLDKITRVRPEFLNKIAKGELSIKGALRLCEVTVPKSDRIILSKISNMLSLNSPKMKKNDFMNG